MPKPKTPEYRNGYGDCKADLLRMVDEAFGSLHRACQNNGVYNPAKENILALRAQETELRRIRAMIKSLKPRG